MKGCVFTSENKNSKARIAANNKYNAKTYDRINIAVPKGKKEKIRIYADEHGESINSFINRAIDAAMVGTSEKSDQVQPVEQQQESKTEIEKSDNWREDFEEFIRQNEEQKAAAKSAKQKAQAPKTWIVEQDKLSREQIEEITRKWLKQQGMKELL